MKKLILVFLVLWLTSIPFYAYGQDELQIKAKAALLMDVESGKILYEQNSKEQLSPASLTKLMTYLLAIEAIHRGEVSLEDKVKISPVADSQQGATYFLRADEEILLSELLEVMMIVSANDTATAIAEHVGGSVGFVESMNIRATELGLKGTTFVNPTGMPERGKGNVVTAEDIAILAKYIIMNHQEDLISLTDKEIFLNESRKFTKENTNGLLKSIPEVDGLKTGYTNEAGYCLVSTMVVSNEKEDEEDFRLVAIILGANSDEDRVIESKRLLEYGRDKFHLKRIVQKGEIGLEVFSWSLEAYPINLVTQEEVWIFGPKDEIIKSRLIETDNTKLFPVRKGEKLGILELTLYNDKVIRLDLVSDRSVLSLPLTIYLQKLWLYTLSILRYFF